MNNANSVSCEECKFGKTDRHNHQVGLKRENEYIPIFEYILSFKDSSSYLEIGK